MEHPVMRLVGLRVVCVGILTLILYSSLRYQWNKALFVMQRQGELSVSKNDFGDEQLENNEMEISTPGEIELASLNDTEYTTQTDEDEDVSDSETDVTVSDDEYFNPGLKQTQDPGENGEGLNYDENYAMDNISDYENRDEMTDEQTPVYTSEDDFPRDSTGVREWSSIFSSLGLDKYFHFGKNEETVNDSSFDNDTTIQEYNDDKDSDSIMVYEEDSDDEVSETEQWNEVDYAPNDDDDEKNKHETVYDTVNNGLLNAEKPPEENLENTNVDELDEEEHYPGIKEQIHGEDSAETDENSETSLYKSGDRIDNEESFSSLILKKLSPVTQSFLNDTVIHNIFNRTYASQQGLSIKFDGVDTPVYDDGYKTDQANDFDENADDYTEDTDDHQLVNLNDETENDFNDNTDGGLEHELHYQDEGESDGVIKDDQENEDSIVNTLDGVDEHVNSESEPDAVQKHNMPPSSPLMFDRVIPDERRETDNRSAPSGPSFSMNMGSGSQVPFHNNMPSSLLAQSQPISSQSDQALEQQQLQVQPNQIQDSNDKTPQEQQQLPQQSPQLQQQPNRLPLWKYLEANLNASSLLQIPAKLRYIVHKNIQRINQDLKSSTGNPIKLIVQEYSRVQIPRLPNAENLLSSLSERELLNNLVDFRREELGLGDGVVEEEKEEEEEEGEEENILYDGGAEGNTEDEAMDYYTDDIQNMDNSEADDTAVHEYEDYETGDLSMNLNGELKENTYTTSSYGAFYDNPRPLSNEEFAMLRTRPYNVHSAREHFDNSEDYGNDFSTKSSDKDSTESSWFHESNADRLHMNHEPVDDTDDDSSNEPRLISQPQDTDNETNGEEGDLFLCPREVKLAKTYQPVTALVAFPEKTTEWIREILEQLTGVETDSIYDIMANLISGNVANVYQMGKKIAIQTHASSTKNFDRAIVFISNPFAVEIKHKFFRPKALDWQKNFLWQQTYANWLCSNLPLLVLTYEDLVDSPLTELIKISEFLADPSIKMSFSCALRNARSPPTMIDDVRHIAGIFYSDRRRINGNIDGVIQVARQYHPEVLARLQSYKVYTGL